MTRQRMTRAERERQILTVAEGLFSERGFLRATMDELAERVGVSKPVIYDYFGSKEGLLLAILTRARTELHEATLEAVKDAPDARAGLRSSFVAFFRFIEDHRQAWSVLNREASLLAGSAGAALETLRRQQADFIAGFLAGHDLTPHGRAADMYAQIVVGAGERLALWLEDKPEVTAEEAADTMMSALWTGLGGPPPA
ncbi:TetR/AcrR family transcriptional regulator [Streptomyces sp. URMC 129]|uniref:TetR/AcrR family transcriptional regulator n=1 Tax=Streptomyces sp. URMC 129 TaxID=3423407 RepID=UPI003F1D02F6